MPFTTAEENEWKHLRNIAWNIREEMIKEWVGPRDRTTMSHDTLMVLVATSYQMAAHIRQVVSLRRIP